MTERPSSVAEDRSDAAPKSGCPEGFLSLKTARFRPETLADCDKQIAFPPQIGTVMNPPEC